MTRPSDGVTVLQFAGASIHDEGRITMTWPEHERTQKDTGRRPSSVGRLRDGLRPFVREFAERRLDSFDRDEALTWALARGRNTQQAVRQFFNNALDRCLIERNNFTHLGASKRRRRIDRPGFQIITDEQYQRLRACARASRIDDYGRIIERAILAIGEAAIRPGELFALRYIDVDIAENIIHIRRQLDMDTGLIGWPKDDEQRKVIISPTLRQHLCEMP
jgi:integrase